MWRHSTVSLGLGSRLAVRTDRAEPSELRGSFFMEFLTAATVSWPNQSLEPTASIAVGEFDNVRVRRVAAAPWLSFGR